MKKKYLVLPVLLVILFQLVGCESISYYQQAISGQLYIVTHRQNISSILEDEDASLALRAKLETIASVREFAHAELSLPIDDQFTTYLDLNRSYVVWNVFAAEEFSIVPHRWCYPVAGCVSYRGYFKEQSARAKAAALKEEGYEVYVGGVSAYSTLGWFSDPVLSTIINREDHELARLIFHELAHQELYVKDDTEFNESFATLVEQVGLQRWLQAKLQSNESYALLQKLEEEDAQQDQFVALVQAAVNDLDAIYKAETTLEEKRLQKQQRIASLRDEHMMLKAQWGNVSPYEQWFSRDLNNAQLATVATYNGLVPAFLRILQDCEDDLNCFYQVVENLTKMPKEQRTSALDMRQEQGS